MLPVELSKPTSKKASCLLCSNSYVNLTSLLIVSQQKLLKGLRKREINLKKVLFNQISWLTRIYVSKFLKQQAHDQSEKFKATHKQKLRNLGLDIYEGLGDEPQVVVNLSNRALTETEYKALNHGLQFCDFVGREKVYTGQKRQKCQQPGKVSKLLESIKKRKTPR